MNKQLRQYLETIGLKAGASDQEAANFWSRLKGDQRQKADALATAVSDGDSANAAAASGGDASADPAAPRPPAANAGAPAAANAPAPAPAASAPAAAPAPAGLPAPSRSQIQGIFKMAAEHIPNMKVDALTVLHTLKGSTVDEVQAAAAELMETNMAPIAQSVSVGDDGREGFSAALGNVLDGRMGLEVSAEDTHARTPELEHLSLIEIGRQWAAGLGVAGVNAMRPEEVAQLMLDRSELASHLGGVAAGHTTSDFAGVLSSSATKTLVDGFVQEPVTYQQWAPNEVLPNLHEWDEFSGGGVGLPKRIAERGEYELTSLSAKSEKKRVFKYGHKIGLTLEMMIQDNLRFFSEQLFDFAGASAALRNFLVYGVLNDNPLMNEDGERLFSEAHNNLNVGGATPLSFDTDAASRAAINALRMGKTAMKQQRGIPPREGEEGRNLRITPEYLLVPEELEEAADVLLQSNALPGQANQGVINPANRRKRTIITDPELSDGSATAWYQIAGKRRAPVKSLTLRGYERPTLTRDKIMKNDTMYFYGRDFCGAAAVEHRSAQKNTGG